MKEEYINSIAVELETGEAETRTEEELEALLEKQDDDANLYLWKHLKNI